MQIGGHNYNTNEEYYIAGDVGANPMNYPRLSSFGDAFISMKNGIVFEISQISFRFYINSVQ
jgi:hypothetical protein